MPTPTAVAIELTDEERTRLEAWTRRRNTAQALALRPLCQRPARRSPSRNQ
jgi:hypothetical protein